MKINGIECDNLTDKQILERLAYLPSSFPEYSDYQHYTTTHVYKVTEDAYKNEAAKKTHTELDDYIED